MLGGSHCPLHPIHHYIIFPSSWQHLYHLSFPCFLLPIQPGCVTGLGDAESFHGRVRIQTWSSRLAFVQWLLLSDSEKLGCQWLLLGLALISPSKAWKVPCPLPCLSLTETIYNSSHLITINTIMEVITHYINHMQLQYESWIQSITLYIFIHLSNTKKKIATVCICSLH